MDLNWETISMCTVENFWKSINILISKPHVVNKRLWGCKILLNMEYNSNTSDSKLLNLLESLRPNSSLAVKQFHERLVIKLGEIKLDDISKSLECLVLELLPKNYNENHAYQLIVLDKKNTMVTFHDITTPENNQNLCPNFTYCFSYNAEKILLKTFSGNFKSTTWLKEYVLPQIVKWSEEAGSDLHYQICKDSLSLIPSDKYYDKYNELKIKYGKELVKIWPECTDPSKYVYEDIAIATYLLLLWNKSMTSFVDVGCGNGLLVYILTMEGYNGLGVDVRKRGIWDMYPKNIKLEEKTITPANIKDFSEYKWIIGNHSDELTPWIPVIAALGSFNNNFFLLPCCAFNLNGTKYKRQNSSKSQYTDYLEYIQSLCEDFGFVVKFDRLKIPSTKRVCLVSENRTYQEDDYEKYCLYIQDTLNVALRMNNDLDFKARERVEKVRNCTQVQKDILESIVQCVAKYLMEGCELESSWSSGKEVEIVEVIKLIPENMLKRLKSECGGLQTLLRNNHHIFKVVKGKVQLRYPKSIEEVQKSMKNKKKSIKMQVKQCWFYDNHPQGCPLSADTCSFLHITK